MLMPPSDKIIGIKVSGPDGVRLAELFERTNRDMETDQIRWDAHLIARYKVAAIHADDGWVNRENDSVMLPSYTRFRRCVIREGDFIALGAPWSGYRIVRVTGVITGKLSGNRYSFVEVFSHATAPETGDQNPTAKRRPDTIGTSDRFKDAAGKLWKLARKGWRRQAAKKQNRR